MKASSVCPEGCMSRLTCHTGKSDLITHDCTLLTPPLSRAAVFFCFESLAGVATCLYFCKLWRLETARRSGSLAPGRFLRISACVALAFFFASVDHIINALYGSELFRARTAAGLVCLQQYSYGISLDSICFSGLLYNLSWLDLLDSAGIYFSGARKIGASFKIWVCAHTLLDLTYRSFRCFDRERLPIALEWTYRLNLSVGILVYALFALVASFKIYTRLRRSSRLLQQQQQQQPAPGGPANHTANMASHGPSSGGANIHVLRSTFVIFMFSFCAVSSLVTNVVYTMWFAGDGKLKTTGLVGELIFANITKETASWAMALGVLPRFAVGKPRQHHQELAERPKSHTQL